MSPDQLWLFIDRLGLNLSALLAVGLGLHAGLGLLKPSIRRIWVPATAIAAASLFAFAAGRLALLNAQIGGGLSDALNPRTLPFAWAALGDATIALAIGAAALLAGMLMRPNWLTSTGALAIAGSFALTGHTQSLDTPGIAPLAVALHVLIAGFWVVAPLTLHPAFDRDDKTLGARLKRFSRIAFLAIPALIVVGVWLAWKLAGGFDALLNSTYGWLLIAKLAAALAAMLAGALNKQFITGLVQRDPVRGRRWLSTTLTVEASLFCAAIVLISLATTTFPPIGL